MFNIKKDGFLHDLFKLVLFLVLPLAALVYFANERNNEKQTNPNVEQFAPTARIPYEKEFVDSIEHCYKGTIVNIVDGDTVDVIINRGFNDWTKKRIRLSGINAPEMKDVPKGEAAKQALTNLILNKEVVIKTKRDQTDIYGRYLGTIYYGENKENVNDQMVKIGQAKIY